MQTYICKCGKTFEKSSKAETTGYVLTDYSPQHECYGCPFIVIERDWITKEITKRECRATPKITYRSYCHIETKDKDFSACHLYSLDLLFVKRVLNYLNVLEGAEHNKHAIPDEWRAADFGLCYNSKERFGLGIFPLCFQKNKKGTAARREIFQTFFDEDGFRKSTTEETERDIVLRRISIAKENARIKYHNDTDENTSKEENKVGEFNINAFMSQQDQLKNIDLDMLVPYHKHPFKLYTGERLNDMTESIKRNGVLVPAVVQPVENGKYEILIGHNRWNSSKLAGKTTLPCIVKEGLSEDEAEMFVIESNLMQRGFDDLSISEQAAVVALKYSSMFNEEKARAIRAEIEQLENGTDNDDESDATYEHNSKDESKLVTVGKVYGLSKNSIARLIRINALCTSCPQMKQSIDLCVLSVRAGVELSYISAAAQEAVFEKYQKAVIHHNLWEDVAPIDIKTAQRLRQEFCKFDGTKEMAENMIDKMDAKPDKVTTAKNDKPIKISMQPDMFRKYFTADTKPQEIADTIEKALEMYFAASASDSIENVGFTEFTLKKLRGLNLLTVSQVKEYVTNNLDAERILDISFEEVISKVCNDEEFADDDDIAVYDFSVHTYNAVKRQRINTVKELREFMQDQSTAENILGIKTVNEIIEKIDLTEIP